MTVSRSATCVLLLAAIGCAAPSQPEKQAGSRSVDNKTVEEGQGRDVKLGDRVVIHYTGKLLNGQKFDSSRDRGTPLRFRVGSREVVPGFSDAVLGMKVGGKRVSTIPYPLAYGEAGRPPQIPPRSDLVFEIELVEIEE